MRIVGRSVGKLFAITAGSLRIVLVLAVLMYPLTAWTLRGDMAHLIVALSALALAFVLLIASMVVNARGTAREPTRAVLWSARGRSVALLALVPLSVALSFVYGTILHERDVRSAKSYADTFAPQLEDYRARHGHFPQQLDELMSATRWRPRLFNAGWLGDTGRARFESRGEGDAAQYEIVVPEPLVKDWVYDSRSKRWAQK